MNDFGVSGSWSGQDNMFAGQWINKNTGEKITISNSIIDNNEMILITSIGQMSMDELGDYIQLGEEEKTPQVSMKQTNKKSSNNVNQTSVEVKQEINDNFSNYLLPEDEALLNSSTPIVTNSNNYIHTVTPSNKEVKEIHTTNNTILEKFFKDNKASINININFDFDEDELKTIMKYVDVSLDDVCEYVYENLFNKETIKKEIHTVIYNKLENQI